MSLNGRKSESYSPNKDYLSLEQIAKREIRDRHIVGLKRRRLASRSNADTREKSASLLGEEKKNKARDIINRFRRGLLLRF